MRRIWRTNQRKHVITSVIEWAGLPLLQCLLTISSDIAYKILEITTKTSSANTIIERFHVKPTNNLISKSAASGKTDYRMNDECTRIYGKMWRQMVGEYRTHWPW